MTEPTATSATPRDLRSMVNRVAPVAAGLILIVLLIVTLIAATSRPAAPATASGITLSTDAAAPLLIDSAAAEKVVEFDGQTFAKTLYDIAPKAIPSSVDDECLGTIWLRPENNEHVGILSYALDDSELRLILETVEVLENPATARARFEAGIAGLAACPSLTYRTVDSDGPVTAVYDDHPVETTASGVRYHEIDAGFELTSQGVTYQRVANERIYLVGNLIYHVGYQINAGQTDLAWAIDHIADFEERIDELVGRQS